MYVYLCMCVQIDIYMCVRAQSCLILRSYDLWSAKLLCPWKILHAGILEWLTILYSRRYQFSSVAQLCPTLCDPMDCSMSGLPVHHQPPNMNGLRKDTCKRKKETQADSCHNHSTQCESSVQLSHSAVFNSLQPHGLQHPRLPCPSPVLGAYSNTCPSSQ